jgi:hypothetical protein
MCFDIHHCTESGDFSKRERIDKSNSWILGVFGKRFSIESRRENNCIFGSESIHLRLLLSCTSKGDVVFDIDII